MVRVLGWGRQLRVSGSRDQRMAAIAEAQRGYVARRQLLAAGVSSDAIDRAVAAGRLHRCHRGVYRSGLDIEAPFGPETAALLALRDGAILSHHTAAVLWGLRVPAPGAIHVLVVGGPAAAIDGVRVHRARSLHPGHPRMHRKLPVTSPARTLIDLAAHLTDRQLEFAVDQAITERLVRAAEIRRARDLLPRAPGRSRIAALLGGSGHPSVTRSRAEECLLAMIRAARLPEPQVNARVAGYEVDFYWPHAELVVEVDGFQYHSTRSRLERDRRKDADLREIGVSTMRYTWRQQGREMVAAVVEIGQSIALRRGA